jgi:LytS/YehU family sensor histidine kinase
VLLVARVIFDMPDAELARRLGNTPRILLVESFTGFVVFMGIVAAHHGFAYYRRYRERDSQAVALQAKLSEAQLHNLKMQLHPHFLFNTLNTVSVLMASDILGARRVLVLLSDLLRAAFETIDVNEVPLSHELVFLERYLEIEQTRFHERLTVRMQIDARTRDALVPTLVLQPLVENAIRHGIAPNVRGGSVEVRSRLIDGTIELQVRDDGAGRGADPRTQGTGVGLANTRARLRHLYGDKSCLKTEHIDGGGMLVTIGIPWRSSVTHNL